MKAVLAVASVFAIAIAVGPAISQQAPGPLKATPKMETAQAPTVEIEPEAFQALQRMSTYLGTLSSFEVKALTSQDLTLVNDQKIKLEGTSTYKVRRPQGMVIDVVTDRKDRRFIFDGRQFIVFSPKKGLFAKVAAQGTNRELLAEVYERYGIALPLEDLFYWSDPSASQAQLTQAWRVGDSSVNGVPADHYAFAEGDAHWQLWIAKGERPLPLKMVITDPLDKVWPEYTATLTWNTNPTFSDATFAWAPPAGAEQIQIAIAQNQQ